MPSCNQGKFTCNMEAISYFRITGERRTKWGVGETSSHSIGISSLAFKYWLIFRDFETNFPLSTLPRCSLLPVLKMRGHGKKYQMKSKPYLKLLSNCFMNRVKWSTARLRGTCSQVISCVFSKLRNGWNMDASTASLSGFFKLNPIWYHTKLI